MEYWIKYNWNTNDDDFVLKYETSQVIDWKKRRYTTEKIRCLREKLELDQNDNPNEWSVQYKFDTLCEDDLIFESVYK